jgi:putative dimethyl sulfoxide reductase chaperone
LGEEGEGARSLSGLCFLGMGEKMEDDLKAELLVLNLLRQVFLMEPDKKLLEGIGKIDLGSQEDTERGGLKGMRDSVQQNENRLDEWTDQLSLEFARLFIGPVHPPAIPFASFYLSETHTLMTEETMAVRKQYLEAGLALKNLYHMPDDHIAFELDFLYYLTQRSLELLENRRNIEAEEFLKMRHDFLIDHFALWAPAFANRIMESTSEGYFKGAASFLLEMVEYYSQEN